MGVWLELGVVVLTVIWSVGFSLGGGRRHGVRYLRLWYGSLGVKVENQRQADIKYGLDDTYNFPQHSRSNVRHKIQRHLCTGPSHAELLCVNHTPNVAITSFHQYASLKRHIY
jgi:hypothetical protein